MAEIGWVVAEQDPDDYWWVTSDHVKWIMPEGRDAVVPQGDQPICAVVPADEWDAIRAKAEIVDELMARYHATQNDRDRARALLNVLQPLLTSTP